MNKTENWEQVEKEIINRYRIEDSEKSEPLTVEVVNLWFENLEVLESLETDNNNVVSKINGGSWNDGCDIIRESQQDYLERISK